MLGVAAMRRTPNLPAALLAAGLTLGAVVPATAATAPDGTPQVIRFDGGGYDRAEALSVDGTGNAYVAGAVDSSGASTFVVAKLSPLGSVLWTGRYNGSRGGVGGSALAVTSDAAGNVYAAGFTGDGVIFN
ncbi:MAG TPA: hypothetical protein VGJ44_25815, partial [Kribbellaceae bacterium]